MQFINYFHQISSEGLKGLFPKMVKYDSYHRILFPPLMI